jgi:hypothetical protein
MYGSQKRTAQSESVLETSPTYLGEPKEGIEVRDFLKVTFSATAKSLLE